MLLFINQSHHLIHRIITDIILNHIIRHSLKAVFNLLWNTRNWSWIKKTCVRPGPVSWMIHSHERHGVSFCSFWRRMTLNCFKKDSWETLHLSSTENTRVWHETRVNEGTEEKQRTNRGRWRKRRGRNTATSKLKTVTCFWFRQTHMYHNTSRCVLEK